MKIFKHILNGFFQGNTLRCRNVSHKGLDRG